MKDLVLKVIDKYIESGQMLEYLKNNIEHLQKWQIIDIICGARADITQKYETLKTLAEFEIKDEVNDELVSYIGTAEYAKNLLDELNLNNGEVFLISEYGFDSDKMERKLYGAEPAFSVQKVKEYILNEHEEAISEMTKEEAADITWWYRLEKYVPDDKENLRWTTSYTIAPNGEIWFARYPFENWRLKFKCHSGDLNASEHLNLPVPFEVGDIITIDCRPFVPLKHGVIIGKGDNIGCCCIQCAYVKNDGRITAGALKHAGVFDNRSFVEVSPLYKAEVFKGELQGKEKVLEEVAEYVKANEEKGAALWDFIVYRHDGVECEMLKEYIMAENVEKP